jgi:hypothetical protein
MVLMSGAVMGMGTVLRHEMSRTLDARSQMQLRQILFAAAPAARAELATNGSKARDVQVALPLEDAALTLHIAPAAQGSEVTANATFRKARAAETLTFSQNFDLTGTTLTQTHGQ